MSRVGIDTGGTFTDFVRLDPAGLTVHKARTTPDDPAQAIVTGLAVVADDDVPVVHGSTVATNAVLERKGARVALVVTAGFEDVLRIGRQTRPELYNVFVRAPRGLIASDLIFGAEERVDATGRDLVALTPATIAALVERVRSSAAEITAVCFLHSYRAAGHEQQIATALRQAGLAVSASHEVLPEYREYERWSTTAVNAYVTPLIDRYLHRLEREIGKSRLSIMQSNGGSISASEARDRAVRTVLSGPAAGVVGARLAARAAGHPRIISFDMGGTSTDVSLVDGEVPLTTETTIDDLPIRLPVIDVHTVGAGGGSIAWLDAGGALRVGPQSAGAIPGPACYGDGTSLTVTDANLLLGRIDPDYFLGGRMTLDVERARAAAVEMAHRASLTVDQLAEGVITVVNAGMERAIRAVSLERGHDPRRFSLVAFGGAGGMHACEVAAELGIETVLVPRYAGVLSALGMLAADVTRDYSAAVLAASDDISLAALNRIAGPLVARVRRELTEDGFSGARQRIERALDLRYVGQSYELTVPWTRDFQAAFHRAHRRRYGYANPARGTEIIAVRVRGRGVIDTLRLPRRPVRRRFVPTPLTIRKARFAGRSWRTGIHRWDHLSPGATGRGPAVIGGGEATVVVPPGFTFSLDAFSNVTLSH